MAKGRKRKMLDTGICPTPEQLASGDFEQTWQIADGHRALAYRRIPVIVTLANTGKISKRQFDGLARYRDVAIADDRSPLPDSVGRMSEPTGHTGGQGIPPALMRNAIELGWLERELGALRGIARAIAVDDMTVAQWAIAQGGSVMRDKSLGRKIITWFEPRRIAANRAMREIRMAGERLAAAIAA